MQKFPSELFDLETLTAGFTSTLRGSLRVSKTPVLTAVSLAAHWIERDSPRIKEVP